MTRPFDLRSKDIFRLYGKISEFERRLDGKLQFLRVEDKELIFLTDLQLAFLSASGEAQLVAGNFSYGRLRGPLPSRLALTKEQEAKAGRKLDYVNALHQGLRRRRGADALALGVPALEAGACPRHPQGGHEQG